MSKSAIEACSALVHKFEANICSILNSSETESPTHSYIKDNNEVKKERKEEQMIASSDISTLSKEQIETTMGNKILKSKDKMINFTELTDRQVEFLVSSTNFSAQQVREWHQSSFSFSPRFIF
jgi:predicted DNA binding protein